MTTRTLMTYLARHGTWQPRRTQTRIRVTITDARMSFNKIHLRIVPTDGTGPTWVAEHTVTLDEVAR